MVARILRAAVAQIEEHGADDLSVEEVARRADVNKTTVYRRWPTRADLVLAALRSLRPDDGPLEPTDDLRADLVRLLRRKLALVGTPEGRRLALALVGVAGRDDGLQRALAEAQYGAIAELLGAAAARGELPVDHDPRLLCDLLLSPIVHRVVHLGEAVDEAYVHALVDHVLASARYRRR